MLENSLRRSWRKLRRNCCRNSKGNPLRNIWWNHWSNWVNFCKIRCIIFGIFKEISGGFRGILENMLGEFVYESPQKLLEWSLKKKTWRKSWRNYSKNHWRNLWRNFFSSSWRNFLKILKIPFCKIPKWDFFKDSN